MSAELYIKADMLIILLDRLSRTLDRASWFINNYRCYIHTLLMINSDAYPRITQVLPPITVCTTNNNPCMFIDCLNTFSYYVILNSYF